MKFENTEVFNFEGAFRGLRNPMDSWDKSDSTICSETDCNICPFNESECGKINLILGAEDIKLAQKMIKGGSEQRKFLRQIFISVDITAPRYWWSEFDTYKIGTVANSCSTMHKLKDYPITLDMFELDNLDDLDKGYWNYTINHLESLRQKYNETKDINDFRKLKQALPESFRQKRTITMNYENILNFTVQREHHRLKEWSTDFINWIYTLPYYYILFKDGGKV